MQNRTYDDLVQLRQQDAITLAQMVLMGDDGDDFSRWCDDHGVEPDDHWAELYLDLTENKLTTDLDPEDYEQLQLQTA